MLMKDILCTCAQYLTVARREESAEHQAQTYHSLLLQGKLRAAMQWISERETGSILQPGKRCTKTREMVMEVLRTKNLEAYTPIAASLHS